MRYYHKSKNPAELNYFLLRASTQANQELQGSKMFPKLLKSMDEDKRRRSKPSAQTPRMIFLPKETP